MNSKAKDVKLGNFLKISPEVAVRKEECLEHCQGTIMDIERLRWSEFDFGGFSNI